MMEAWMAQLEKHIVLVIFYLLIDCQYGAISSSQLLFF